MNEQFSKRVMPSGSDISILFIGTRDNNMGLLSDPNRRRALISLLVRLNAPIWYADHHDKINILK